MLILTKADPHSSETGIPNRTCPSDHIPVAASFESVEPPSLSQEEEDSLLAKFKGIEAAQIEQLLTFSERMQGEQECIEATLPPSLEGAAEVKKGGKKGGKPPPEVMVFMQKRRVLERDLKAELRTEREAFFAALGELELDLMEAKVKNFSTNWVGTGPKPNKLITSQTSRFKGAK